MPKSAVEFSNVVLVRLLFILQFFGVYLQKHDLNFAHFPNSTTEAPLLVTNKVEKIIDEGPFDQRVLIGSDVRMPCRLKNKYSKSIVRTTWLLDGKELVASGRIMEWVSSRRILLNDDNSLSINQVGPDSVGHYECHVSVSVGFGEVATDSSGASLSYYEKPAMPMNVRVQFRNESLFSQRNENKIDVSWTPGFDGNTPILHYTVEMRTISAGSNIWNEWITVKEFVPNITAECCSLSVENIRGGNTVEFRVVAFNKYGSGRPSQSSNNVTLPQKAPNSAPTNIRASARSSSSIMVQWESSPSSEASTKLPYTQSQLLDDINGYVVRYRLHGYQSSNWVEYNVTGSATKSALLEPLIAWREYEIQISAWNERGFGIWSSSFVTSTLEGVPFQAPQNVKVEAISSTSARISFDPPHQQMVPGVNLGYKIELWTTSVAKGKPAQVNYVLPNHLPEARVTDQIIDNLEKYHAYNLTVLCFTAPGDGPRSDLIQFQTLEDVPDQVENLVLIEVSDSRAQIQWAPPLKPNGKLRKYTLEWWSESIKHTELNAKESHRNFLEVSAERLNAMLTDLTPSTNYTVEIQAHTNAGAGSVTQMRFTSSMPPEIPGQPHPPTIIDVESNKATIQFSLDFDGHAAIRNWFVEARFGGQPTFQPIFNISNFPKSSAFTIDNLRPYTDYQIRLIVENVRGKSPPSEPSKHFQTKPSIPESAPEGIEVDPISSVEIIVNWAPLLAEHWNGPPLGYVVQYKWLSLLGSINASKFGEYGLVLDSEEDEETFFEDTDELSSRHWQEIRLMGAQRHSTVLNGLVPYSYYAIRVASENTLGRGRFSEPFVVDETYPGVPISYPENVRAELLSSNAISVTWNQLDSSKTNGPLLGYKVSVFPKELHFREEHSISAVVSANDTQKAQFYDLRFYTTYVVKVFAFTIMGDGPKSPEVMVQTNISVPAMPVNVSFPYRNYTEVLLNWNLSEPNGELIGYQLFYQIQDDLSPIRRASAFMDIPSNLKSFLATNLVPNSTYVFVLVAVNQAGRSKECLLRVFTSPINFPISVPPQLKPKMPETTHNRSPRHLSFDWHIPEAMFESKSPVRCVELQYQTLDTNSWTSKNGDCLSLEDPRTFTLNRLRPNTAYRTRIRFFSDDPTIHSEWSAESEWVKTMEAPPTEIPRLISAIPLELTSAVVRWQPLNQTHWNADKISYNIYYYQYGSDRNNGISQLISFDNDLQNDTLEHIITGMSSFRRYVVEIRAVNVVGMSPASTPLFLYIGYSVPKGTIQNLTAEPISSTSIKISWNNWTSTYNDLITAYRVRYTPLLNDLKSADEKLLKSISDSILVEQTSLILTGLQKFVEYQISVVGHNRAGDGQASEISVRTHEDLPGAVGLLHFHDISLDSVNVTWTKPAEENGIIRGYVVQYNILNPEVHGLRKDISIRTPVSWLFIEGLNENMTYNFSVIAETTAGAGSPRKGNVTLGWNEGAPDAPLSIKIVPQQTTFILYWKNSPNQAISPIKGYFIQAKRVGVLMNVRDQLDLKQKQQRRQISVDSFSKSPKHVVGQWINFAFISEDFEDTRAEFSYQQLEPASFYVFRVYSRNDCCISKPSAESDQLRVTVFLPSEPFYTRWWFLVIIALALLIVVLLFAGFLFITGAFGSRRISKVPPDSVWDHFQLNDGSLVAYELRPKLSASRASRAADDLGPFSRQNTAGTWLSKGAGDYGMAPAGAAIYGSVDGLLTGSGNKGSVINMYSALTTDEVARESILDSRRQSTIDAAPTFSGFNGEPIVRVNPFSNFHCTVGSAGSANKQQASSMSLSGGYQPLVHFRKNIAPLLSTTSDAPPRWRQQSGNSSGTLPGTRQYFLGGAEPNVDESDNVVPREPDESDYDRLGSYYSTGGQNKAREEWIREKQKHQEQIAANLRGISLMPKNKPPLHTSSLSSSTVGDNSYSPNPEVNNNAGIVANLHSGFSSFV